jgi:cellulose synthase/poly-beta-1,6-N-acetylglucosamine synthase-like glycosyltransferase
LVVVGANVLHGSRVGYVWSYGHRVIAAGGSFPDAPLVSVIVPVFNGRDHVVAAIESALAQSMDRLEVVVVDDGSLDGSGDLAESISGRDPRVRVVRQENRGPSAARNTGVRESRGTYVGFLDADDLWLPEKLERQVPLIAVATGRVVFSDGFFMQNEAVSGERILGAGRAASAIDFEALLERNPIPVLTVLVERKLLLDVGGFDESLLSVEDWDLWFRLHATGRVSFIGVDEPLACYRVNPGGLSSDRLSMARWRLRVLDKLADASSGQTHRTVSRRCKAERQLLAGELRLRAWRYAGEGLFAEARVDLREAWQCAPRPVALLATAVLSVSDQLLARVASRRLARS